MFIYRIFGYLRTFGEKCNPTDILNFCAITYLKCSYKNVLIKQNECNDRFRNFLMLVVMTTNNTEFINLFL